MGAVVAPGSNVRFDDVENPLGEAGRNISRIDIHATDHGAFGRCNRAAADEAGKGCRARTPTAAGVDFALYFRD